MTVQLAKLLISIYVPTTKIDQWIFRESDEISIESDETFCYLINWTARKNVYFSTAGKKHTFNKPD